MKKSFKVWSSIRNIGLFSLALTPFVAVACGETEKAPIIVEETSNKMQLTSQTFKDKQIILDEKYTAYGQSIFPQLSWGEVPAETKSLAIFMHDKDAPIASGFWHLQVVDIDPKIKQINEGVYTSIGFDRNNDTDQPGYFGPMPPQGHGLHEYRFTIYALPFAKLTDFMATQNLTHTQQSSRAYAAFIVETNALSKGSISFYFEKK